MCHQFTITAVNFFSCVGAAVPNFPLTDNFPYQRLPKNPTGVDFIRRKKVSIDFERKKFFSCKKNLNSNCCERKKLFLA